MPNKVKFLEQNSSIMMLSQVLYERVNLADIETSSDEDDYGDLFAQVLVHLRYFCTSLTGEPPELVHRLNLCTS